MLSLVLSTIVFFAASYAIKRYLDDAEIPKGITRTIVIFVLALALSYAVAAIVEWIVS
jgi:VIT1/CCC1 family predicted Fe2+/Mn2+ transporter